MTNAPRAPIDVDAFERDLQTSPQAAPKAAAPAKADPLAELARIVGQDDPFRSLLQSKAPTESEPRSGARQRTEPSFVDSPTDLDRQDEQAAISPADAFDQYLASVEQGAYAQDEASQQDPAAFEDGGEGYKASPVRSSRKRYLQVGAALGVLTLCVTGALGWKSLSSSGGSNGEPVTVLADKSPLKEAPPTTDGVEIPDQNKQIYDRNAKDGQIKIVNREEQPVDVTQAVRSVSREGEGQGGATPSNGGMLAESLGEPRRVRTVSVKPDTPPPAMQQQRAAAAEVAAPKPSPIPTMVMPDSSEGTQASAPPRRPSRTLPSRSVSAEPAAAQTETAEAAPEQRNAAQRVASVSPETTASTTPEAPPPATTASVGGFSVQLGVRSSENDARAAFRQMQSKYSQLSGKPELIRHAEVNGKAIYRVRVGPLAKSEANSLCSQLQGAGAACFVAKN